ncbi:hypothetical protein BC829DRAFT_426394 [Chytridium lagenaria]|nr:hypothetical protein BC829DRAFT_426394 [Chytridium lagenaria]
MQDRLVTDNMNGGDDLETRPLITQDPATQSMTTFTNSTINLTNTILGAGVLAMPGALASVGLGLGILMMLLSAAGSIFGLTLLSMCAGGCGVVVLRFYSVKNDVSFCGVVLVLFLSPTFWVTVAILLVSPLAYARHLDSLKHTSAAALMALVYLVLVVVGYFIWPVEGLPEPPKWEEIKWVHVDATFFSVVPIFVFAFSCHHNIFAVYNELIDNTLPRITTVIHTSIASPPSFTISSVSSATSPSHAHGVHPSQFQHHKSLPLQPLHHPCPIIHLASLSLQLPPPKAIPRDPVLTESRKGEVTACRGGGMWGSRTGLLVGSFGVAVVVGDLERVLSFVGATGSTMICYILPGMLYFKMRDDLDRGQGDGVQRGWFEVCSAGVGWFGGW